MRPYPHRLEEWVELMKNGERCLFRPILPEDEPQLLSNFISRVTKEGIFITATLARSTNLLMKI
ncbi:hypothetical protein MJ391_21290 [Escherichia coli]|nr:hypothetical protein MJ391_21290 [Escherichia coli]